MMGQMAAVTHGQEEERRRLARELHDDTIQSLIALNQRVLLAKMKANGAMTDEFAEMEALLADMIGDVRRFTHALRPIGLEELGLIPAIELLAESNSSDTFDVTVLEKGEARRLPMAHEFALYRITQEALQNVVKHAKAEQVVITLAYEPTQTVLRVEDDGGGFTVPTSLGEMARRGSYGLLGIYERAELIQADVGITSDKNGTKLELVMTNE